VISRGNERQAITRDDTDRVKRVEWLRRTVETYGWRVHAFVLMPNHDHLFLETPRPNLSRGMQFLNGCYSGYFNKRHGRVGHLFQGRFKALLIEKRGHYTEISRYIHLNPVRSGLVMKPEDWKWSSYAGYFNADRMLEWVTYSSVLEEFGSSQIGPRAHYRNFVSEGLELGCDAPGGNMVADLIVGSEEFVAAVRKMVNDREDACGLPQLGRLRERPSVDRIIRAVADILQVDTAQWTRGRRVRDHSRALAAFLARRRFGYSTTTVAQALGYATHSGASSSIKRIEREMPEHSEVLAAIERELEVN
jgi:putative transposase